MNTRIVDLPPAFCRQLSGKDYREQRMLIAIYLAKGEPNGKAG